MNTNMLNVDLDKNNIVEPPKQGEKKLCNATNYTIQFYRGKLMSFCTFL